MGVQSAADRIIQNIANAFTAVSDKGGTVPSSQVSGNLASAINSIPSGVTVQRASGTFTTSSSTGGATVTLGFQPDLLFVTLGDTYADSTATYYYCAAVEFNEIESGTWFDTSMYSGDYDVIYEMWGERTSTGFQFYYQVQDTGTWGISKPSKTFNYVALKYT